MDSVDKLRARIYDSTLSNQTREDMERIADEIEAEIETWYEELPANADGDPIYPGDYAKADEPIKQMDTGRVACIQLRDDDEGWKVMLDAGHKEFGWYRPSQLHYVAKPRTLEDVLLEFGDRVCNSGHQWGLDAADVVPQFAAEIRELMGGDAE